MEKQSKVVQMGRVVGRFPMVEETEELANVNAELVRVDCATEDEIIEAAKDKCGTGGS